jgi:DNA-binding beta-propeller fold protein YncE
VDLGEAEEVYVKGERPLSVASILGTRGSSEGQFSSPRNVAIGPDGAVYVADSGNHRIQQFASGGAFVTAWGHMCKMYENMEGCEFADGAGGFYDPWGIAVDAEGFVYVADTWNHRIQKFTADGEFVTMCGQYGMAETGAPSQFWGPRDIAVAPDGLLYVSDTGNKRIQVFTPDGQYVTQWGGKGITAGQFDEPVGIAVSQDGRTYVVDTWNQRIQAFDANHFFTHKWEVDSWYGQSLENKPYLAVDAQVRVYATDPEASRILVFDATGKFLASLGEYGTDDQGFVLPTGIAIDREGYIYVADPGAHRVIKLLPFAP